MNNLELHKFIETNEANICQIIGIKDGEIKYQDTWHNFLENDTLHVMSVTKSIVSLLIGIALDKGFIKSIDEPVLNYFPNYQVKRGEKTIQQVTIRHLLTMTAPYKYKYEPWSKICSSDDWTIAALNYLGGRSGLTKEFKYSTLGIHILNGIITKTSGLTTVEFANKYLFTPLDILPYKNYLALTVEEHKAFILSKEPKSRIWFCDPQGVATTGYGLCISALDMAKIGVMCLNDGKYHDKQIISTTWLEESTIGNFNCGAYWRNMSYGYLWWIIDENKKIFAAIGNSGNVIYINKNNNIVITVTGTFKPKIFDRVDFIQKYIEPMLL